MRFFLVSTVLNLSLISSLLATVEMKPVVTKQTLIGVWEAVSERDIRIFQLEIRADGSGILVDATEFHAFRSSCEMDQVAVENGQVDIMLSDETGDKVSIKGSGRAAEEGGVLEVILDKNPNGTPNIWELKFYKFENRTYVKVINEMSDRATRKRESKEKIDPRDNQ